MGLNITTPSSGGIDLNDKKTTIGTCADATVTNQAEDYSLSIASGATEKLPFGKVKNKEGADVQVDYKPASEGYIFEETACPASLEVTVALSDSTPRYDETITITATAAGATSYTFYLPVQDGSTQVVTQASNTYNWKVKKYGAFTVVVTATDGSASGVGSASGTTSGDFDADAIIAAQEAAISGSMDATAKAWVLGTIQRLKGIGTSIYENAYSVLQSQNADFLLCFPNTSATASVAGFSVNAIDPTNNATMAGFVPSDATINGLTGGSGKYIIFNNAPSDFGQDDVCISAYVRSGSTFSDIIGADNCLIEQSFANPIFQSSVNSLANNYIFNQFGWTIAQRNTSDRYQQLQDGIISDIVYRPSTAPSTNVMYGMASNQGGTPTGFFSGSVSAFLNCGYLNERQMQVLTEAVEWLQTQIGRNV